MKEVKLMKTTSIFPAIKELLDQGKNVRITVTGTSMYPFLRENIDSVELSATCFKDIQRGDIVIILRDSNEYVMHRVIKKLKNSFYIMGDAQQWIEGPLRQDYLIGKITTVWRGDKKIYCKSMLWRLFSLLWLKLLPIRHHIFQIHALIHKISSSIMKKNTPNTL